MRLFRQITPLPDENLAGLIARAAGANVYTHAHDVLDLAGLGGMRPASLAVTSPESAVVLGEVLGATCDSLLPLYIRSIDERRIDFYGTELRSKLRDPGRRRLSPRALSEKAYIRAVWSVKPLGFDPRTKETLISDCPVCGGKLGFTKTWGVEYCEHCIGVDEDGLPYPMVDLREYPQALVQVDDVEALDFVTDLIDPAPQRRCDVGFHEDLAALSKGQLFELAIAIGTAITADDQGVYPALGAKWRPIVDEVAPIALAKAGRAILHWPAGMQALFLSASKTANARPGDNGTYKAFGYLAQLHKDAHLTAPARVALSKVMDHVFASLGRSDLALRKTTKRGPAGPEIGARHLYQSRKISPQTAKRMGQHPDMITYRHAEGEFASVFFNSWQAHKVVDHFQDLCPEASVCTSLGLPPDAVRDLCSIGLVEDLPSPYRTIASDLMNGGRFYSKAFVDHFVDMMINGLEFKKLPKSFIPFSEAMLMFPAGRRPWLPVMLPILFQDVDAVFHHNVVAQPKVRNIFGSISVDAHQFQRYRDRILEEHRESKCHDIGRVSAVAANLMLGIYNHHVFMACAKQGLLDVDENGAADYRSVLEFADRFIFGNEAAVRSRNRPQAVGAWLDAHHIRPVYSFPVKGGLIFDRAAVEPWLELKR